MREIKVRGYAVEKMVGSQWMYGTGVFEMEFTDEYAKETGVKEENFVFTDSGWVEVRKQSIGQFTGLKDKNSVEIYEGDIVKLVQIDYEELDEPEIMRISNGEEFYSDVYILQRLDYHIKNNETNDSIEIIGNIYENPELLEVTA
ncbi:YopX family protein [Mammaliicoccus sciuri]